MGSSTQKFTLAATRRLQDLEIAAIFLTVLTNFMVTALITFYIRRERRALSDLQISPLDMRLYTGAVALVVESALPLTVVGLAFATLLAARPLDDSKLLMLPLSFLFYALCVSHDVR